MPQYFSNSNKGLHDYFSNPLSNSSCAASLGADVYRLGGVLEECFHSGVDGGELIRDAL